MRAEFAVHRSQYVFGAHCGAHADMRGFMAEARWIGTQLSGALQVYGLRVENPHQRHGSIHPQEFRGVLRKLRHRRVDIAFGPQDLSVLNFELCDSLHV